MSIADQSETFDGAEFYDCDEQDTLTCTLPEEAIEQYVDVRYQEGETLAQAVAKHAPLTVVAYERMKVRNTLAATRAAEYVVENFEENITEEFGQPGGGHEVFSAEDLTEARVAIEAALNTLASKGKAWTCEKSAEREYSAEELTEILVGWFDEDSP